MVEVSYQINTMLFFMLSFVVILITVFLLNFVAKRGKQEEPETKGKQSTKLMLNDPTQEEINHVVNWLYHNGHITFKEHEKIMNRAHSWIE